MTELCRISDLTRRAGRLKLQGRSPNSAGGEKKRGENCAGEGGDGKREQFRVDAEKARAQNFIRYNHYGRKNGQKLFIMCINHICKVSNILKYVSFADDTNMFCSDDCLFTG